MFDVQTSSRTSLSSSQKLRRELRRFFPETSSRTSPSFSRTSSGASSIPFPSPHSSLGNSQLTINHWPFPPSSSQDLVESFIEPKPSFSPKWSRRSVGGATHQQIPQAEFMGPDRMFLNPSGQGVLTRGMDPTYTFMLSHFRNPEIGDKAVMTKTGTIPWRSSA